MLPSPKRAQRLLTHFNYSVKLYSPIITPTTARETENGKYEIVSGHRRKYACEYLGYETVPVILKELDRNEAVIFLVGSTDILPSERVKIEITIDFEQFMVGIDKVA